MDDPGLVARSLRRGWWLVAASIVIALATAVFLTARETARYRATTTLVVRPSEEVGETDQMLDALETLERRTIVATFARIPSTRGMRERVANRLKLQPEALRDYRTRASVVPYTNAIEIVATGPDPNRVEAVARATSAVTREEATEMYRIFSLETLEPAAVESDPIHPDPRRNYLVAVVVGLFVGLVAAIGVESQRESRGESSC